MVAISTFVTIGISIALSVAMSVVKMLLTPQPQRRAPVQQQTQAPKPADGKYNLKQNVPPLTIALGRVKKGGDYVFLEERNGGAYHCTVMAAHRIHAYVQHYLHDEEITLTGGPSGGNTNSPAHFGNNIAIDTNVGLDVETAFSGLTTNFSDIWSTNHRGDGLASVLMFCNTVNSEDFHKVYTQGMPVHTCIFDGALVYDPRDEAQDPDDHNTWVFSRNLALLRLHHLTQPWGGRLSFDDMHLPDWENAADVCDDLVTNRSAATEPRYYGGIWFRVDNDPVEIGRILDEAAELSVYERPDGKIGVHAGEMVAPTIRITVNDIIDFRYDANRRRSSTVLATRGRYTDPDQDYNTVDAAIFGDPYIGDDTQRTNTVDNQAVQSHNHMQRLQKLAFTRANAARVSIVIAYDSESDTRNLPYNRFVTVHYPSRGLDEATVEIVSRPKLSLANLTISFDAIIVPDTLYDFNAATEEGVPSGQGDAITPEDVPVPIGLTITSAVETLVAGQSAVYALASWTHVNDAFTYELEYQLSDESEPPLTVMSQATLNSTRTIHLRDGAEYQFRLRTWSNGKSSDWTSYVTETVSSGEVAPGQPIGFAVTANPPDEALVEWVTPNSPNLSYVNVYRGTTTTFADAVIVHVNYTGPNLPVLYGDTPLGYPATYYYWVGSFNASGIGPAPVGPESVTL